LRLAFFQHKPDNLFRFRYAYRSKPAMYAPAYNATTLFSCYHRLQDRVSMEDCAVCPIAQAADFIRSLRKTLSAFFHPIPPISQNQYFVDTVLSVSSKLHAVNQNRSKYFATYPKFKRTNVRSQKNLYL